MLGTCLGMASRARSLCSLHRLRVTHWKCGRGAQIVGRAVAGTLGEKCVEQRIGLGMVARRDQRLGERKTRRDIVGRRLELPAVVSGRIGVRAAGRRDRP